jgi:hypothetical protein
MRTPKVILKPFSRTTDPQGVSTRLDLLRARVPALPLKGTRSAPPAVSRALNHPSQISISPPEGRDFLLETPESKQRRFGQEARARLLTRHTPKHRALELESYVMELRKPSLLQPGN